MASVAGVYIIDIPFHADIAYRYRIPGYLEDTVVAGSVVEVSFGKGNRSVTGIVAYTDDSDDKDLKPVNAAIGNGRILSDELIGLCRFMKEYTLCTFGDAVRSVIPASALAKVITTYRVISKDEMDSEGMFDTAVNRLGERSRRVYELVKNKKKFTRQYVQSELEFECSRAIAELEEAGLCEKCVEVKDASAIKKKKIVSLDEGFKQQIESDGGVFESELSRLRGANQRKLLRVIRESEGLDAGALFDEAEITPSAGKAALAALTKSGYVAVTAEEDYRNPFSVDAMRELTGEEYIKPVLSEEQMTAYGKIEEQLHSGEPRAVLLHGVTGSGKTNVILEAIDDVLNRGRGVIMLVPEIGLTPQTVSIFMRRYGDKIAVIHSGLSAGERYDTWRRIKKGLAPVVIGTRSAVFAPLENIGLIVIDEEHEHTYKSDISPKYHARDIARYRCAEHGAVMLLASATPSVTSYYKAKKGIYTLVELNKRYGSAVLPKVEICDMRKENAAGNLSPVSSVLASRIREDRNSGNQSILFLNRRGYNNYVSCRKCGKSLKCPRCSVTLTYHERNRRYFAAEDSRDNDNRENGYLTCHTCGYKCDVPNKCPDGECGSEHFLFVGCGTQKAEDDIAAIFPDLRVLRMDLDTTRAKFSHEAILSKFRNGEADVLLGTQMVTKGHDFPRVATVGVLNADAAFTADDYRAAERTFAMLTQVIGRAGRGDVPGHAIIQTRDPDNEVLRYAVEQDYKKFYEGEIKLRKALCFPPFCDIAVITISCEDEAYLARITQRMSEEIVEQARHEFKDVPMMLYGPFEAPVYRVQDVYRMRFVMKCRLNPRSRAFLARLVGDFNRSTPLRYARMMPSVRSTKNITVSVDLNPTTV
ncbi:MAG: primosomal protein N' [Clostridia bacterium]|nr:primosomal protein N' [Clostridia bacterium]